MSALLEVEGVGKRFGGLTALDNVSFQVPEGAIVGVMGGNGAGKTTLFSLIAGNARPSAGDIRFRGRSIVGLPPDRICRLGVARTFQIVKPFPAMTVRENLRYGRLEASDVNLQIGIDPTGGLDPSSPLIVWSEVAQPLSRWETLRVQAEAEAAIITLFLRSAPNLPKRLQSVFWRNAFLRPIGRHKRGVNIVGLGDTHISLEPEQPRPGEPITAVVSSSREHKFVELIVARPDDTWSKVVAKGRTVDEDRFLWRYQFSTDLDGLYDIRFVGDFGARLLALRLLQVARNVQLVPSDSARLNYRRVYVLLPPTANQKWALAAVKGGYDGRFTIGFSADDAGIGNLENRHVLAVNPHHWPEVLTASWFQQHYPGVKFTAVVANQPEDLEAWLKNWTGLD